MIKNLTPGIPIDQYHIAKFEDGPCMICKKNDYKKLLKYINNKRIIK